MSSFCPRIMTRTCQLCIFLFISCYLVTSNGMEHREVHHKVAYVFAGSTRSFTEYFVQESIRTNLIHSFCPPNICQSVVFARVSLDDNVHQLAGGQTIKDGSGMNIAGDLTKKPKIVEGINRLGKVPPRFFSEFQAPHSPTVLSWGYVGSPLEREEMEQEYNTMNHKVFRSLDARRYSMYYNRQKSYQQVAAYEKEHNMTFTWVVHARLDAIWGEPVQPVHFFETLDHTVNHRYDIFPKTSDHLRRTGLHGQLWDESKDISPKVEKARVWAPDTWWSDVPDTFALLPRHYSDTYFSLDGLVESGIMCIGGPNFAESMITPAALDALNFSATDRSFLKANLCAREDAGFSERILKRKLTRAGISLDKGTLGYQSFFMAIVRPNLDDMCFYLEQNRLHGFAWALQYANNALNGACMRFMDLMRQHKRDVTTDFATPVPVSFHSNTDNLDFASHCSHDGDGEFTGMNCLLDKTQTDWNFMPFRLHKHHQCLTSEKPEGGQLLQQPCVTNVTMSSPPLNSTYSRLQLFHILPLLKSTQQIRVMSFYKISCLTVARQSATLRLRLPVTLEPCFSSYSTDRGLSQQFLVRVLHSTAAEHLTANEHRQFIVSPKNNPHSILPAVSVVSVAYISDPDDRALLDDWHPHSHKAGQTHRRLDGESTVQGSLRCLAIYPKRAHSVIMEPCDPHSPNQKIVIERSSSVAWVKYIRKRIEHEHYFPRNFTA